MATQITFHPLVDGVLTMARLVPVDGAVEEYALERDALERAQAALADAGHDPPELVRRRVAAQIRRVGWLHLPTAA